MAVGKNKGLAKSGKKGVKKKIVDPFTRKDWYDVKAPNMFSNRKVGVTVVNRTQGTKIASEGLKGRVFEVSLADLQKDSDAERSFRKFRLIAEEVQGRDVLTNFHGMDLTTDKLRSMVKKWQTLIEANVDVKTTDGYLLRVFCIGFTHKDQLSTRKTCYAQHTQVKAIRKKMVDTITQDVVQNDLKEVVCKLLPDSIAKDIEKKCQGIYPLHDVYIRKVKVLKKPRFDINKLLELHEDGAGTAVVAAVLFWLFFLWHWIPSADGGLSGYCSRKVTKTLMSIVHAKVGKAIAKQEATRLRSELKAAKAAQITQQQFEKPKLDRAPTVPTLTNVSPDKLQGMPVLGRSETMTTLPPYTSRPGTPGGVELANMEKRRPAPSRTGTLTSNYSSRSPLVGGASDMGYSGESPPSQVSHLNHNNYPRRQDTMGSSYSNGSQQPLRPMLSASSRDRFTETPAPIHGEPMPYPPPSRAPSARPMDSFSQSNDSFAPIPTHTPSYRPYDAYNPDGPGRASPAPTVGSKWGGQQRPMNAPMGAPVGLPMRSTTAPIPRGGPQYPQRNMTAPVQCLSPVGERSERYSMTSSVVSSSVMIPHGAYPDMLMSPPPRAGAASVAPSSVVLTPAAHANMAGPPPVPRVNPSPGPGGYSRGYDPYRHDVESQRGYDNWN